MTNFYKDKQDIIAWLDKYEVKNYTLIPDEKYGFVVDVSGDVDLSDKNLINIPVKFSTVKGNFYCYSNKLTSLEFCPKLVGGHFWCNNNQLASLEFCPQTVGGSFWCYNNNLTSLEFCPKLVGGDFWCNNNQLASLEFCPQSVSGHFWCNNNQLASLEFSPQKVGGNFYCYKNPELKDFQNINNFNLIYLEHKKTLITKFSNKLNKKLPNENSKKSTKIKI